MNKFFLLSIVFIILFILSFTAVPVYCQTMGYHDLGKFTLSVMDNGQGSYEKWQGTVKAIYPQGLYRRTISTIFWSFAAVDKLGDEESFFFSPRHAIIWPEKLTEYRRWAPPTVYVDGYDMSRPFIGTVDNNLVSDIYIDLEWKGMQTIGLRGRKKSWSFTNTNHDDYVIISKDVKLTFDIDDREGADILEEPVDFVWTDAVGYNPCEEGNRQMNTGWNGDNTWYEWEEYSSKLVTNRPRKNLIISYVWDGDNIYITEPPNTVGATKNFNDTGDPDSRTGLFLSPQYGGFATFHVDKSPSDASDDPDNQPTAITVMNGGEYFATDFWREWQNEYSFYSDPANRPNNLLEIDPSLYENGNGFMFINHTYFYQNMKKDDDVNAVYVVAAGSIDEDLCKEKGEEWYNWYWNDQGNFDDAAKDALLVTGKDSLFQNIDRAYWAYNRGFDVPDPLPAPDLTVNSGPDRIEISWGYPNNDMFKDPDTGADDFKEWRLYRKMGGYYVDDALDVDAYYKYELIGTFPKATTSYLDNNVIRGIKYHYCVTAVDDGSQNKDGIFPGQPLESSYYANRTRKDAVALKPGENISSEVVIVPNPYSLSTGITNMMNWPGAPNEIRFMNLPAYCTLKIYTATGDLIRTFEHTDGSADGAWTYMRTDANQYPASGVYILAVDNARDIDRKPLPKQMYKFVIVR